MYNKLVAELVMGRVCMGRVGYGPSLSRPSWLWAEMSSYLGAPGAKRLAAEFLLRHRWQVLHPGNRCYQQHNGGLHDADGFENKK